MDKAMDKLAKHVKKKLKSKRPRAGMKKGSRRRKFKFKPLNLVK